MWRHMRFMLESNWIQLLCSNIMFLTYQAWCFLQGLTKLETILRLVHGTVQACSSVGLEIGKHTARILELQMDLQLDIFHLRSWLRILKEKISHEESMTVILVMSWVQQWANSIIMDSYLLLLEIYTDHWFAPLLAGTCIDLFSILSCYLTKKRWSIWITLVCIKDWTGGKIWRVYQNIWKLLMADW